MKGKVEKAYRNKSGYWAILVNETWYGTGKEDYTHLEGDIVEFETEQNGKYWNVSGAVKSVASAPAASGGGKAMSADNRQQSIVLQSSFKTSAEVVGSLIAAGAIGLGAKNKAFDAAMGLVEEGAIRIYKSAIDPESFLAEDAPGPGPDGGDDYNPMEA